MFTGVDGTSGDSLLPPDGGAAEIEHREAGQCEYYGEVLELFWLPEDEARQVCIEQSGFEA